MTNQEKAKWFIKHPAALGRALGYKDFLDNLHGMWIKEMVTTTNDMTLQSHRGSYKTTCLCCAMGLLMLNHPDKNIIFLRKTDNDVSEVINNVTRILTSDIMKNIYAALTGGILSIKKCNSSQITLESYCAPRGSAQLLGIGIGGSITGKHADILITDDIVNVSDRVSRAEREKTKLVYQELQNVLNPGGRFINTGTPWHKEDAFSLMTNIKKYDCYSTGLLGEQRIAELRKKMTPSLFAANYELRHIASENALFETMPEIVNDPELLRDGIAHIDAAYDGEDYTAFTCGKRVQDTIYLYGKLWRKHVDTVLDRILADADRFKCAPIYTEQNGDKGYLGREIRNRNGYAYVYTENQNKFIKISSNLHKWWGNIVFIKGTDPEYISQILDFTDAAEHDDAPDSAACVVRILDRR